MNNRTVTIRRRLIRPGILKIRQIRTQWPTGSAPALRVEDATLTLAIGITELIGDVTAGPGSASQATIIAANVIRNAKLAQMVAPTFKSNNGDAAAAPPDLTAAQLTVVLEPFVGDGGSEATQGLAPAPAAGDAAAGKYLKAAGTWAIPPGSGITQLTGDITTGPGTGLQATTLADTGVVAGLYKSADTTVNQKGRITGASNGVAAVGSSTKVIIPQRNSAGIYPAPGLAPTNTLSCGFSSQDDLSSTPFNFSASEFVLAPQQMGNPNGWYAGAGQTVDPTSIDWLGFILNWFYR